MSSNYATPGAIKFAGLSDVTASATEINYVAGVTSAIQTQLTGKKKNWVAAPAAADSTGVAGDIAYESGFLYVCVATDTWQRVAIATWP